MSLLANITGQQGPSGPPGTGFFRPSNYDLATVTYSGDSLDHIIYTLSGVDIQRVTFMYTGDQLTSATVVMLPGLTPIRVVTYTYTGDQLSSWAVS